jgi:hypothetical protein
MSDTDLYQDFIIEVAKNIRYLDRVEKTPLSLYLAFQDKKYNSIHDWLLDAYHLLKEDRDLAVYVSLYDHFLIERLKAAVGK